MAARPKYVDTLASATSVAFGPVGVAAVTTEETWAYRSAVADGDLAIDHFDWLLENGTPAARVYAGFGLRDVAPARGAAALDALETDDAPITHVNGCFVMESTVADVVRAIRGHSNAPTETARSSSMSNVLAVVIWGLVPLAFISYGVYSCAAGG